MERTYGYARDLDTAAPIPSATVTVYDVGTLDITDIFSDDLSTPTPLANPFTADAVGAGDGYFFYYAPGRTDVRFSGGIAPVTIPTPYTWGDASPSGSLGYFIATEYGVVCDGTTDDRAALFALEALIPATGGTIFFGPGVCRISSNLTFGSNVTLIFADGAQLSIDVGVTVTIQGPLQAARTQIFSGAGATDLTDALLNWVYPEWWGAIPLKAASGVPGTDSTDAIDAAVDSNRDVLFDAGIYGTTGGHLQNRDGQTVRGQGAMRVVDGQAGTNLFRLSGTATIWKMGAFLHMEFGNILIDGNNLDGDGVEMSGCQYATLRRVRVTGIGGTGYALFLSSINVSLIDQFTSNTGNFGGIKTDSATQTLYTVFTQTVIGGVNASGFGLDLQSAAFLTFVGGHIEGPNRTGTNCRSLRFYNMTAEISNVAVPYFALDSTTWNVSWMGGYVAQSVLTTQPFFEIDGTRGVTLRDIQASDILSAAGREMIQIKNSALNINIANWSIQTLNAFDFIVCSGANPSDIVCNNNNGHSGSAGTNVWKCSGLVVTGGNMAHTFLAGMGTAGVVLIRPDGAITKANVVNLKIIGADDAVVALVDGDTTPDIGAGDIFSRTDTAPTTVTDLDGGFTGKIVAIRHTNNNTTYDFSANANLKGNLGADWTAPTDSVLTCVRMGTIWYCTIGGG